MEMRGLTRKFWMMTSWMRPYCWCSRLMAEKRLDAVLHGFADAD